MFHATRLLNRKGLLPAAVVLLILAGFQTRGNTQQPVPTDFGDLAYRHIGPQGNRMIAVVGVPGDLDVYYGGAASGGVWK